MTFDLTGMDPEELDALRVAVLTEQERQQTLAEGPSRVEEAVRDYQEAAGRVDGQEWEQPVGAHDAYHQGAVVVFQGAEWESLIPANVWRPGVSGWRSLVTEYEEGEPVIPDFVQPTGGHDAYQTGDLVEFEGAIYASTINGNVWTPTGYPQGWEKQ